MPAIRLCPTLITCGLLAAVGARPLPAQATRARSADYLFLATASDVRAVWLNPASPGVAPTASLMGELVFERGDTGDVRVAQWTGGFSSRGISFGYQRDLIPDGGGNQAFRVAAALPFRRGAVGLAFTFYKGDQTERGLDLGMRYRALRQLDLGAVIRHIGRPAVRADTLPLSLGLGAGWDLIPPLLQIAGEAHIAERPAESGHDTSYRFGARILVPAQVPIGIFAAFDLESGGDVVDRWAVGVRIGGRSQGLLVTSGAGSASVDRISLTGLAVRSLGQRR